MLLLQHSLIAWLVGLSVATSSNQVSNQFSQQLVTNFSNYQCQPQPSMCNYFNNYYGAKFVNNHTLLRLGFCATYEEHTRMVSLSACPYFQLNGKYSMHKEECNTWYIQLPNNVSKLNDYMCGPLNRKGRVCSECKDGFGPAIASFGFQIQCSNCTASGWYGILLYMFLEIVPVTIFYLLSFLSFKLISPLLQ